VINYSTCAPDMGLIMHTTVTIGYDAPWRQVHQLLIDAALQTEMILKKPKPFVLQTALNDFYISYQINAYTRSPNEMAVIFSNLHQNIQDSFNKAGVEIMSPHYKSIRDGNTIAIPEENRAEGYKPPSFRIQQD
jgi:small-conductance mechanosensitive channel